MKSLLICIHFLSATLFIASCASPDGPQMEAVDPATPTPVFNAIAKYERDDKARGPLGGDWKKGIEIFSSANGASEARILLARGKSVVLLSQGAGSKVIGLPDVAEAGKIMQDRKVRKLGIPETGVLLTGADHQRYIEAATKFGQAFNQEMLKRIGTKKL